MSLNVPDFLTRGEGGNKLGTKIHADKRTDRHRVDTETEKQKHRRESHTDNYEYRQIKKTDTFTYSIFQHKAKYLLRKLFVLPPPPPPKRRHEAQKLIFVVSN